VSGEHDPRIWSGRDGGTDEQPGEHQQCAIQGETSGGMSASQQQGERKFHAGLPFS